MNVLSYLAIKVEKPKALYLQVTDVESWVALVHAGPIIASSDFHLCFLDGSKNISGGRRVLCIGHRVVEMFTITVSKATCVLEKVRLRRLIFFQKCSLCFIDLHMLLCTSLFKEKREINLLFIEVFLL